jgi:ERCC4-type nuclease
MYHIIIKNNMIIQIDYREQELYSHIERLIGLIPSFKDIKIETKNLEIGDIIIFDSIKQEVNIIIERKSINDLLSSIKDGRYEEQSYRLNGLNIHNHNVIYLIEGDVNKMTFFKHNKTDKMTVYSAIFSLNYYKGFSVIRTFTIEETAIFICTCFNKINKPNNRTAFYNNNLEEKDKSNNAEINANIVQSLENLDSEIDLEIDLEDKKEPSDKDYISVIKKVKKENITPDNIGEIMLCQIPGVSSITAIAIMNKFQTLPILIKEIEQNNDCLKDISYTNSKSQIRKISKTSITNIIKFLIKK